MQKRQGEEKNQPSSHQRSSQFSQGLFAAQALLQHSFTSGFQTSPVIPELFQHPLHSQAVAVARDGVRYALSPSMLPDQKTGVLEPSLDFPWKQLGCLPETGIFYITPRVQSSSNAHGTWIRRLR